MAPQTKKFQSCPNGRWSCIVESWKGARRNVEKFPNKDHRSFVTMDQAYAYMDECGHQRPHNFVTDRQATKIDCTTMVPDGWIVEQFGHYHYDPDQLQTFDTHMLPTQANASSEPNAPSHANTPSQANVPSHSGRREKSRFLPGRRYTKSDEMVAIAGSYRKDESFLQLEGAHDDIHADVRDLKRDLAMVLQALASIAPSSIANPGPGHVDPSPYGLRPTFKKESPPNDQAPAVKQEPFVNEPAPPMHHDAALSHKLFIAGTPPRPEDEFHHEPHSYDDDDDSGSDYDSSSDEDDEIDEVAVEAREAYQEDTSDYSSAPSSQETAEPVCTPPSSPVRRRRSNADDGELDEPPSKKVRPSSISLQAEVVTHIKSEDNIQSAKRLESEYDSESATDSGSEYDSESEAESQSDNHPVSEPNVHIETTHYSVRERMDCLRELVTQLGKPDGVDLSITGTELASSATGTGDGMVPPAFHGRSLNMADHNKVRLAVIDLFKHYSTIMVRTERKVDVVVL